jgi:MFS superfamily sulfate permease-like transporter
VKLKWVPGALIAVTLATVANSVLGMPVRRVQIADGFLGSLSFLDVTSVPGLITPEVLLMAVTLAFVASAETLLSAAAVDQMHNGPKADYNRELLSQGIGNTLCGLLGSLPMTGVIVRSAANVNAGAKTRLSAIMHGFWLLLFVASAPWLLRMVPTASLAAVLVYTGWKLVNVQNVKRLLRYGGAPVVIYAATVIGIVTTDLLKGILLGLVLSICKVVYARTHFGIRIVPHAIEARTDVYLEGAASFIRLPAFGDKLESVPMAGETHIHLKNLDYIDDACLDALSNWQHQRNQQGGKVFIEWNEALKLYRDKNPLADYQGANIAVAAGSSH